MRRVCLVAAIALLSLVHGAACGSTLSGVDVSSWQGTINWDNLKAATSFAIMRSSYGSPGSGETVAKYTDTQLRRNQSEARRVGILRGYYHYSYPEYNPNPQDEANQFLNAIGSLQAGEILCLDFEESYSDPVTWCAGFLQAVYSATGIKPFLYINYSTVTSHNWSTIINQGYPLWLADWDFNSNPATPTTAWGFNAIKQYSDKGNLAGLNPVDLDTFNGGSSQFTAYGGQAPAITTQPQAQTICSGTATFTVAASGTGTLSYQWQNNGSNISGANSSSYTTGTAGAYDCVVTNSFGSATSSSVALSVGSVPSISSQPSAATICSGNTNTFTVGASGSNLSYQWRLGGSNITGATSSSYATGAAGSYSCVVSNTCGSATSNSVSLTVNTAPSMTTQPTAATVCSPNTNTFTVAASGTPAPTYQWRLNTGNIAGATSASYTTGVAGTYDCVITNSCGSVTSSSVALTVNSGPSITTQPTAATICSGSTNTFTVVASASPAPTYQWRLNGTTVSGATSASYATGIAGTYDCVITNSCGTSTSNAVALTVNSAPSITTQPQGATVCSPNTATFTVAASGPGLSYQWRRNNSTIAGATSSSYATGVAGSYDCVVTNSCGTSTSNTATLTVNTAPTLTSQPTAAAICSGSTNTFSVSASGTNLSYHWRLNGSSISGANSSSYATDVAGNYDCVVTNSCGTATSTSVALTVNTAPSITTQPQSATISASSTNTFSVAASGSNLSYQWRLYRNNINGATASTYTTGIAGSYDCVVTNSCGTVTSNAATLTISGGTPVATVAAAKAFADGTLLTMSSGPIVTWSFNSFFYYIEDVDRAAAMRVIPSGSSVLAEGSVATIVGTIQTLDGERVIQGAVASNTSSGTIPGALGMTGNSANLTLAQGLLVRLWGVASVAQGATDTFTLRDGSDNPVRVKLYGIGLPDDGAFVNVIGVLGEDADGHMLRVNSSGSIW